MIKWERPSGSIIELKDTENFDRYARANGWKKKSRKSKKVEVIKHDDSGTSGQEITAKDTSSGS